MHHAAKYISLFSKAHPTSKHIPLLRAFLLNVLAYAKLASIGGKIEQPATLSSYGNNVSTDIKLA